MIISIRLLIDEAVEDALSADDCLELARTCEAEGNLDVFDVIFGRMDRGHWLSEHNMPGLF